LEWLFARRVAGFGSATPIRIALDDVAALLRCADSAAREG